MSKIISTAGMTPFNVTIEQTVPAMVRFVRAMARTGAKVSSSPSEMPSMGKLFTFMVWLKPMYYAMFQTWCQPLDFQFIAAEAIKLDGTVKTRTPGS